jgi:signal transduction histidine kinase
MSLQARLTLWSVLVMASIVGFISALDLTRDLQRQFQSTLERAELLKNVSVALVLQSIERERNLPFREALALDPNLREQLRNILSYSPALMEIAVSDRNNRIIVSSEPRRVGESFQSLEDFELMVAHTGVIEKARILFQERKYYQLVEQLGADGRAFLYVRVVVYPYLIGQDIRPSIKKNASVAVGSVFGAVVITFAFSVIAFRPLGKLGHMLDLITKGEYESGTAPPGNPADEISIVASKVSLLGEQLRGAKYDFSDLRGNFERLLDQLEDAVLIFGRDRRLFVASGAVEKFLGRQRDDLLGQTITEIFPANTTLGLLLAQSVQTGRPIRNRRVPIMSAADSQPAMGIVLLSIDLVDEGPAGPGGISVRLRDPEATRQIGRQLQTADRLSAASKITGGVAHEVKNPLNAILMHVDLVKMKLERGNHSVGEHMDIISREIVRLDRVVKTFLDFTRPVELNFSEVQLEDFMNEIVDLARPQAGSSNIEVSLEQDADDTRINIDVDLLKQAVLNIVVNAIEAMPDGGRLSFQSRAREDQAEIRIGDTGPGIPEDLREKIFSLYFTTKQSGSGIGLAMTYRIVQLHDGTIDFTSEPGVGTTFVLTLPIVV